MTATLRYLIAEATALAGGNTCLAGHAWESEGGRACNRCDAGRRGCASQTVYRCARCGTWDYGEPGGPAHAECERHCAIEPTSADELQAIAWELYCRDTAGGADARDFWHELPEKVQEHYLAKAAE